MAIATIRAGGQPGPTAARLTCDGPRVPMESCRRRPVERRCRPRWHTGASPPAPAGADNHGARRCELGRPERTESSRSRRHCPSPLRPSWSPRPSGRNRAAACARVRRDVAQAESARLPPGSAAPASASNTACAPGSRQPSTFASRPGRRRPQRRRSAGAPSPGQAGVAIGGDRGRLAWSAMPGLSAGMVRLTAAPVPAAPCPRPSTRYGRARL